MLAKNPRITLHFTPTGCSWINLVECFFSVITRQSIRRGSFTSVRQLTDTIGAFIDHWNDHLPAVAMRRMHRSGASPASVIASALGGAVSSQAWSFSALS